jgi:hypothetical protein
VPRWASTCDVQLATEHLRPLVLGAEKAWLIAG